MRAYNWRREWQPNGNHFSLLAWEIHGQEEPDGLQSMGSQIVGHDLVTKQQTTTN